MSNLCILLYLLVAVVTTNTKRGQGKPTARISANVNGLSAFCYPPPAGSKGEAEICTESPLLKAEIRAVNLPRPHKKFYSTGPSIDFCEWTRSLPDCK
jgi:hypothetical protein